MKHARKDYNGRIVDLQNSIPEDEPVFLLRGQDILAPELLLMWASKLRLSGGDPKMARIVEDHAQLMLEWQKSRMKKLPDLSDTSIYSESDDTFLEINSIILSWLNTNSFVTSELVKVTNYFTNLYGPSSIQILSRSDLITDNDPNSGFNTVSDKEVKLVIYYEGKYIKVHKYSLNGFR